MNKPAAITAHVDAETLARVEQLAAAQGQTPEQFAAEAIQLVAGGEAGAPNSSETELLASLEAAERQIDDGSFVRHDEIEAWLAGLRREAAA